MAMFETLDEALLYLDNPTPYRHAISVLLAKLDDPDADSKGVADILANDSVLSASIMKIANSAYYGMSGRVRSLPSAISVLGFMTIRSLGIAALLNSSATSNNLDIDHLVLAGLSTAIALESDEDIPAATATCVGLLADIGRIMLRNKNIKAYEDALVALSQREDVEDYELSLIEIEKEIFGFDHCEIGSHLLKSWNFPDDICQAVKNHGYTSSKVALERTIQRAVRLLPEYKSAIAIEVLEEEDAEADLDETQKLFLETKEFIDEYLAATR